MAREWFGRKARPAEVAEAGPESPADPEIELSAEPAEGPDAPSAAAWLGAAARRRLVKLGAWVAAQLPTTRTAVRTRLTRLVVSIVAGLLLYASFPPRNCWWAAVVALALLAWVLTHRATTPVGGLGYGLLFGLVFYVSLLPWIGELVGPGPWLALATTCALFPGIFGLFAVVVRLLPGWPIWFAVGWAAQEWLKSILPFGGFPWGRSPSVKPKARCCRWSSSAVWRCCQRGSAGRMRLDRDRAGNREVVANRWSGGCAAGGGAAGRVHMPGLVRRHRRLAAGAACG